MSKTSIETVRRRYAGEILRLAGVDNPRIEAAFATVPREAFLPGPPWRLARLGLLWGTADVFDLYDDVLVVIDRARGINNGEPALHAAWLAAVDPQPGETAIHVGAGTGYYTAILATLVQPGGKVEAYEYEADLAEIARSKSWTICAGGRPRPIRHRPGAAGGRRSLRQRRRNEALRGMAEGAATGRPPHLSLAADGRVGNDASRHADARRVLGTAIA